MNATITNPRQEIHLWPAPLCPDAQPAGRAAAVPPAPLPLPFASVALREEAGLPGLSAARDGARGHTVVVEPFFNQRKQLRLFAIFPEGSAAHVNGEAAPGMVVLAPGDFFRWRAGLGLTVALFNKPQIGPPHASVLGKPCPVSRVPFAAASTCVVCLCGVALHREAEEKEGLQCAQLGRTCPVCQRPLVLTEG